MCGVSFLLGLCFPLLVDSKTLLNIFILSVSTRVPYIILFIMKRGALVQLKCAIQHYDWGVSGQTPSAVAELGSLNREEKIDEEKPRADGLDGAHLSGLNVIKDDRSVIFFFFFKATRGSEREGNARGEMLKKVWERFAVFAESFIRGESAF